MQTPKSNVMGSTERRRKSAGCAGDDLFASRGKQAKAGSPPWLRWVGLAFWEADGYKDAMMTLLLRKQVALIWWLLVFSSALAGERVVLFNGKDLGGWKAVSVKEKEWQVGTAVVASEEPTELNVSTPGNELVGNGKCPNLISEREFGDCRVELEFMIPKNSNSGIKLMRIYEIQILDSYGKEGAGVGDCGAIYKERAPNVNACKKPGEWQRLLIEFKTPRFDDSGKKVADAQFVKVVLNGQVLHENVSIPHGTNVGPDVTEKRRAEVLLQGDHGPVAFRNIAVTELE